MAIEININDVSLADLERLEEASGKPVSELYDDLERMKQGQIYARDLVALVYMVMTRRDPAFSIEDARQVGLSEIEYRETGRSNGRHLVASDG